MTNFIPEGKTEKESALLEEIDKLGKLMAADFYNNLEESGFFDWKNLFQIPKNVPEWLTKKYVIECGKDDNLQKQWRPKKGDWYLCMRYKMEIRQIKSKQEYYTNDLWYERHSHFHPHISDEFDEEEAEEAKIARRNKTGRPGDYYIPDRNVGYNE